jgi:acyl-CoA thioesterase-1
MSVINAGISGDTTGGMLSRLSSAVPPGTKIVVLQIAGNDAMKGMSPAVAEANRAKSAGNCTPVTLGPLKPMGMYARHF